MPVEQTASESVAEAPSTVNKENSKAASADLFNAKPKSTQKSKKIISKCERLFLADQAKLEKLKKQTERNNEQVQKEVSKAEKLAQKDAAAKKAAEAKAAKEAEKPPRRRRAQ